MDWVEVDIDGDGLGWNAIWAPQVGLALGCARIGYVY